MNKNLRMLALVIVAGMFFSGCSKVDIDYEIAGGQGFSTIQGTFSDKTFASYTGYMYYFTTRPVFFDRPWDTATLHSPAAINGGNDMLQCYIQEDGLRVTLNFYCGGSATTPAKPPTGTYQVNVGSKTYTFNDVDSRIVGTDLDNVFVPEVKLTVDGSGKVAQIDWRWWKKVSGSWVTPSNSDLASELDSAGFEIGQTNWAGDRANGDIALTTTGQVIPPAQGFTPGAFRIYSSDKAGYHYGFEWR